MPLNSEDKVKYKALYLQTAKPYIGQIINGIQALKNGQENPEQLEETHRSVHSLASQSQMMEYASLGSLARMIEAILKAKIDKKIELQEELMNALINAANQISASVDAIESSNQELDLSKETETLQSLSHVEV
jgi:chemotaxis protein histidine kinase CheA